MKIFVTCFFILLSSFRIPAQSLEILPEVKLYDKYYADALSHQFSLLKDFETSQWFGNVGAEIPLLNLQYENHLMQVSAASTVFNTVIKTPGHIQVYTVDYLVDFYFDYNLHPKIPLRFIFGHQSAHYSDDGITELFFYPISYVRDYVGLHLQYQFHNAKLYAGYYYNFHIEPEADKKNNFQFGGDKFFNIFPVLSLYASVDFKLKSEVNFTPTQSYQAGIKISAGKRRAARIAYTFRNGFEERGQLYNKRDAKHTLGVYLDF